MLRIKKGPFGARLGREMAIFAMMKICQEVLEEAELDFEISSGLEGEHTEGSFHYKGEALDYAVRNAVIGNRGTEAALKADDRLGDDFDVIWNEHKKILHAEWQPKTSFGKLGH